ncbi:DNA polymerase III, delta subunit [Emticicia oligotrophica DSM 17448]|uniref:DNA polymerase III subunit delta n=1 Tax=Emticicia oligotrophica (strain DSM 17448 / CIP 109782 / MTCC 6937 / GPTSA100-15) TaxID=929562 RepID=A0ABN4ARS6_EMTOG|nr:DNA polymerase III subunit delta [Emticicia oligotrophica]AFK05302.1 DNA polymerase III, delta subunit [Emticicia oligotrophica DSM 17448]
MIEILKSIKKDSIRPLYFLHGEEVFYIEQVVEKIQSLAIPVHEKGFNEFVLFGKELSVGAVLNYARRFPMMAERQLIIVKEANQIQGIDQKENQKLIEDYALNPLPSTILVLCFTTAQDERKTWVKAFAKNGVLQNFKKLYDNQLPEFVSSYCHGRGVKISMKAIQLLIEHIGNDLKRLASELEKVILNIKLGEGIDADIIQKYVGISKEYNVFELQKALIQRDVLKANQIINFLGRNPKDNPIQPILIILYNFFSKVLLVQGSGELSESNVASLLKVNSFFAKDYILAARNYSLAKLAFVIHSIKNADLKSKGVEVGEETEGEILKKLVFEILH